jgi:hypothetical protein
VLFGRDGELATLAALLPEVRGGGLEEARRPEHRSAARRRRIEAKAT